MERFASPRLVVFQSHDVCSLNGSQSGTMAMYARREWILSVAIVVCACRHGQRGQELAMLSEVPEEIVVTGKSLVIATLPSENHENKENVYVLAEGSRQPRLLKTYRIGKFDVDQDHLYYAEHDDGGAYVVPLSGGDARQLAPSLQGK